MMIVHQTNSRKSHVAILQIEFAVTGIHINTYTFGQEMKRLWLLTSLCNIIECTRVVLTFLDVWSKNNLLHDIPHTIIKNYGRRLVLEIPDNFTDSSLILLKNISKNISTVEWDNKVKGIEINSTIHPLPWNLQKIGGYSLWQYSKGIKEVVVAVLDTGITESTQMWFENFKNGYDFVTDLDISVDGDGRDPDATDSEVFVADSGCDGPDYHGTKVSSVIGAAHKSFVFGIAPGCTLLSIKALGLCSWGLSSDVADAIIWAAGGEIIGVPTNRNISNIIVLSLAGDGNCPSFLQSAINYAVSRGIVVAAATGNDGRETYLNTHPANCIGVKTVGSINSVDQESWFSNKGGEYLYPGEDVVVMGNNKELTFGSGTSYANAHYAGVLALNLSIGTQCAPCPPTFLKEMCMNYESVCCSRYIFLH